MEKSSDTALVNQLLNVSRTLWDEGNFKGLLKQFARQLHALFGMVDCAFVEYTKDEASGQVKLGTFKLKVPDVPGIQRGSLEKIKELLRTQVSYPELFDGMVQLSLDDAHLGIVFAGDNEGHGTFFVGHWTSPLPKPQWAAVEFMGRQVQAESNWLRKLDQTQAMLYRDDLTGLFNYRYFEIAIEAELRRSERFANPFCLLFIDLDNFKRVNDTYGHMQGSDCLKQVADIIREQVREVDIPIRYGGDEYVVLLLGANADQGLRVAERVRAAVEAHQFVEPPGEAGRLTASIGVAAYPEHGGTKAKLLGLADETMYKSKKAGKNRVTMVKKPRTPARTLGSEQTP